jgi:hypothetical protein
MSVLIKDFRSTVKNTLRGYLTVQLCKSGIEISDLTLHVKDGDWWVGLPFKPYYKADGSKGWKKIIRFEPEAKYHLFQKLVLNAFKTYNESRAGVKRTPKIKLSNFGKKGSYCGVCCISWCVVDGHN